MVMAIHAKAPTRKSVIARVDFLTEHTVFEALESLACYGCANEIKPGDHFTRRGDRAGMASGVRYPFCLKCRPVVWSGVR